MDWAMPPADLADSLFSRGAPGSSPVIWWTSLQRISDAAARVPVVPPLMGYDQTLAGVVIVSAL